MRASEPTRVLIACRSDLAAPLARAFAARNIAPVLAFAPEQLATFLDASPHDVVVATADVANDVAGRLVAQALDGTALMLLGAPTDHALIEHAHDIVPLDLPPDDVVARADALGRSRRRAVEREPVSWGPLELDVARRAATWRGAPLHLTPTELRLLRALVVAQGAVVDKATLQHEVWPGAVSDDGSRLGAHVRRIRTKLEPDPARPAFLVTARGEGFRLADLQSEIV